MNLKTEQVNAQKLIKAQLYIQNNLDEALTLDSVAKLVGSSSSHFNRLFKQFTKETLKEYIDRLRIEKSIYDIRISELSLLDISLRYGFNSAENYSRVFKRVAGYTPSSIIRNAQNHTNKSKKIIIKERGLRYAKGSNFSLTRLSKIEIAFMRYIGPYEKVPLVSDTGDTEWKELENYVLKNKLSKRPIAHIGIPQDSPNTTDSNKMRYDCGIVVKSAFVGKDKITHGNVDEGIYGVLTHAGNYESLANAYQKLFRKANDLKNYTIAPKPMFELLIDISAKTSKDHTWTELYIPLNLKHTT